MKLFCCNYWQNPQISAAVYYFQKQQPSEVFCKTRYSQKVEKFHRKTPVLESVFNKVADIKAYKFIEKKLQHRCFPLIFAKFLGIPIFKKICEQLLLFFQYNYQHFHYYHFHYHCKCTFTV